ncbi:hypothetical protein [Mesorhizobium dulcispinae]|uniref:hypothetical protein n=1 Tax=Mesorhizobium dulcispinae TaxID=3072316 RepID=UPI002A24109E|nr:hypothetical protein [Mesorhizobium sp. VK23D]MDX8522065.1 hypothetical protein [Mesorhizobium sp. VK23D]
MILIRKPEAAPARLAQGAALVTGYNADFLARRPDYESGSVSFDIETNIYGHQSVKAVLRTAQLKKCCFCEGIFEAHAAADVEHYRPKKYSQQAVKRPRVYPGYYWLAYSWDNLFYCCQVCNRSHKKNFFPLRNPNARARNHLEDIAAEEPLLLNPSGPANPRDHIKFRQDVAVGVTEAGDATVRVVGLNRNDLSEERLGIVQRLVALKDIVKTLELSADAEAQRLVTSAREQLDRAKLPEARYSAMASDLIDGTGVP